ncbi:MAG: ribosome-associated translation inhibitor RaiA [Patescibacteria group bacterium]
MNINIKSTNIEITPPIKDYVEKRINGLEKFIHHVIDESVQAWVEVGRTTRHHQTGDIFRAEMQIHIPRYKQGVRAEATCDDLYAAIDKAHDELKLELEKVKEKKISLVRKGARLFKKLIPFFNGQ